jgi:DNA-binding XRE family transcriptional regulator
MRFAGRVFKSKKYWPIEVPILGVYTQGLSKRDAYFMIADAIELLVDKEGFKVDVYPGKGEYFEIGSTDTAALAAALLREQRTKRGLSLEDVAKRLGAKSNNAYARYEQGRSTPTIEKLSELLMAVSPDNDFVLSLSQGK